MSNVTHPSHYNSGKIEVIEAIEDWAMNFHKGNAIKYIARAGKKDPTKEIEDLEKAVWYLKREIEVLKSLKEGKLPTRPNDMNPKSTSATNVSNFKPRELLTESALDAMTFNGQLVEVEQHFNNLVGQYQLFFGIRVLMENPLGEDLPRRVLNKDATIKI